MSPRHTTSLVLAFAVGPLLPLVCVPDALHEHGRADPGIGLRRQRR